MESQSLLSRALMELLAYDYAIHWVIKILITAFIFKKVWRDVNVYYDNYLVTMLEIQHHLPASTLIPVLWTMEYIPGYSRLLVAVVVFGKMCRDVYVYNQRQQLHRVARKFQRIYEKKTQNVELANRSRSSSDTTITPKESHISCSTVVSYELIRGEKSNDKISGKSSKSSNSSALDRLLLCSDRYQESFELMPSSTGRKDQ